MNLTHEECNYILQRVRLAEDDLLVQQATIIKIKNDMAIVERIDWHGKRLLDYPVLLPKLNK